MLIKDGCTEQFRVVALGEAKAYEFYTINMVDDVYTLSPVPDAEYRLMVGSIEICTLTVIDGKTKITS
jgi:hypothetical protein